MNLFATYGNNLFFHAYRRVVFYLMFAFNKYLMELFFAYFISVNGKKYLFMVHLIVPPLRLGNNK